MSDNSDPDGAILSDELARVYARESGAALSSFAALRDKVCQYVGAMRDQSVPLDDIIARVSVILERARVAFHAGKNVVPPPSERDKAFAQQIVEWCTEFYHASNRKSG